MGKHVDLRLPVLDGLIALSSKSKVLECALGDVAAKQHLGTHEDALTKTGDFMSLATATQLPG